MKQNAWLKAWRKDHFVKKSKQDGWRSRATYKLIGIDEKTRLIKPSQVIIELGAAPGGWSQYVASRLSKKNNAIAIDLLEMKPIPGVQIIQGDVFAENTLFKIQQLLNGRSVDLVLSDMAPNLTGVAIADQANSIELVKKALDFCHIFLKPGGDFLAKTFSSADTPELIGNLKSHFQIIKTHKPDASRPKSSEIFLLCRQYLPSKLS